MTNYSLLAPIRERWVEVFGEPLEGIGFGLYPKDAPMLERCLAARSTAELDRYLERLNADDSITR